MPFYLVPAKTPGFFLFFSFLFFFFPQHRPSQISELHNHNSSKVTTITRFYFTRIKNSFDKSQGSQDYTTITRIHFTRLQKNHKIQIHYNYKSSPAEFPSHSADGGRRPPCLWPTPRPLPRRVARCRQAGLRALYCWGGPAPTPPPW